MTQPEASHASWRSHATARPLIHPSGLMPPSWQPYAAAHPAEACNSTDARWVLKGNEITCRGERPGGCSTLPFPSCSSPWLPVGVGAWNCSRGGVTGPSASPADLVASDAALPMLSVPGSSAQYLMCHTLLCKLRLLCMKSFSCLLQSSVSCRRQSFFWTPPRGPYGRRSCIGKDHQCETHHLTE